MTVEASASGGARSSRQRRRKADRIVRGTLSVASALTIGHLVLGAVAPPNTHNLNVDTVSWAPAAGWGLRIVLAAGAALCLVLGPGIALRHWTGTRSLLGSTSFVWIPGLLYLVVVGIATWLLESILDPQLLATALLVPIPVLTLWSARRSRSNALVNRDERVVFVLVFLLVAIGIGRATWSQGPTGELYGGTVSRTLEAGDRSDPRIQYHVVQLVTHGDRPYSRVGSKYFKPYSFYARGPIAGLAAAPVVLSGGARPGRTLPDQPWEPFDAQGFAAYRIVLMVLGASLLLATYGVLRWFLDERVAFAGIVLIAMTPFVVHEVYFTWPKLLAAAFGFAAILALLRHRPGVAGLLVGFGYLSHPSGVFAAPALVLIWAALLWRGSPDFCTQPGEFRVTPWVRVWVRDGLWLLLGVLAIYGAWWLANAGHTFSYFTGYLTAAGGKQSASSFGPWVDSRWTSIQNTLIPFRLYLTDPGDRGLNSYFYYPSPGVIQFSYSYQLTLPFAVGFVYFPAYLYGLARFARQASTLFCAATLIPFLGFIVFWGDTTAGVLREGLHFVLVLSLIAAFFGHSVQPSARVPAGLIRLSATLRAFEVAFLVLVPTIATNGVFGRSRFEPTDLFSLILMLGGILTLGLLTWRAFGPRRCTSLERELQTG